MLRACASVFLTPKAGPALWGCGLVIGEGGAIFGVKKRHQKWDDASEPNWQLLRTSVGRASFAALLTARPGSKASRCSFCRHTAPAWDKGGRRARRVLSQPKQKCGWHRVAEKVERLVFSGPVPASNTSALRETHDSDAGSPTHTCARAGSAHSALHSPGHARTRHGFYMFQQATPLL